MRWFFSPSLLLRGGGWLVSDYLILNALWNAGERTVIYLRLSMYYIITEILSPTVLDDRVHGFLHRIYPELTMIKH